jgi:uncharacterized protein YuzE
MKPIKMLIILITTILAMLGIISCKDTIVPAEKMPSVAKSFVEEYFPGTPVSYVKKEPKLTGAAYEIVLQDGTEIEFNSKGEWNKVDCKRKAVPAKLIPATITDYVNNNFPGQFIVKIAKEHFGTEIELDNDLELKFDKNGKLMNIDD